LQEGESGLERKLRYIGKGLLGAGGTIEKKRHKKKKKKGGLMRSPGSTVGTKGPFSIKKLVQNTLRSSRSQKEAWKPWGDAILSSDRKKFGKGEKNPGGGKG